MKKLSYLSVGILWGCLVTSSFATSRQHVPEHADAFDGLNLANSNRQVNELYSFVTNTSLVPEVLSTMFVVDLNPVVQTFDTTLTTAFVQSLSYFFETIFQAQTEFDINVNSMDVTDQHVSVDQTLSLTTTVNCIFKPQSGQALSDRDMEHILIHIINRYQSHLVKYMRGQQSDFGSIETAFGHSLSYSFLSSKSAGTDRNVGLIVATVVASLLLVVSLSASWVLYTRQLSNRDGRATTSIFRRLIRPGQVAPFDPTRENLSPFRDKEEIGQDPHSSHESTIHLPSQPSERYSSHSSHQENDEAMETIEFGHSHEPRFLKTRQQHSDFSHGSHRDEQRSNESQLLSLDIPCLSPTGRFQESSEEEGTLLPHSLSPVSNETIIFHQAGEGEQVGSRFEIYAPPGKLGVAIDVIDGHPVVYRIKPGSPLTGFLRKMDRIIDIDGIDTTHMSAADVTNLMVKNMSKRRKITYIRGDAVFT